MADSRQTHRQQVNASPHGITLLVSQSAIEAHPERNTETIMMKAISVLVLAVAASAATANQRDIRIQLDCKGINADELTAKALSYSAMALEGAFNRAHKGSVTLSEVGAVKSPSIRPESNLRGDAECSYGGSCCNCLTFSALVDETDAELNYEAWAANFESKILLGHFTAFEGASKCSIDVSEVTDSAKVGTESDCSYGGSCCNCLVPVMVEVQCQDVDFKEASLAALSESTNALKESFNAVYDGIDGNQMDKVVLSGHRIHLGGEDGEKCSYGGSCCNCGFDDLLDYSVSFMGKAISGEVTAAAATDKIALKAWEDLFLARLRKVPSFVTANHCEIAMKEIEPEIRAD